MTEMPKSAPEARGQEQQRIVTGPEQHGSPGVMSVPPARAVFHDNVAKVRISSGGARNTATFKGKSYTRDAMEMEPGKLGWSPEEIAKADADGSLVIERFDADGDLINQAGEKLKRLDNTPRPTKVKAPESGEVKR